MHVGYAKLFEANEGSHALSSDQLKGLVAQVSGTEENMTNLIAGAFRALVAQADFNAEEESGRTTDNSSKEESKAEGTMVPPAPQGSATGQVSPRVSIQHRSSPSLERNRGNIP